MSSFEFNTQAAPDMLQLNMENISKELNNLIVTGEQEFGMSQQFPPAAPKPSALSVPVVQSNFQVPNYSKSGFHGQLQQSFTANGMQFMKHNLNYNGNLQQPFSLANNTYNTMAATPANYTPTQYLGGAKYSGHSTLGSTQALQTNISETPTYEFHYLRTNGDYEKKFSSPYSSFTGNGAYRKVPRLVHKHFHQKLQNAATENDSIKVDLSSLDFSNNNQETSTVRHLFDLLRDLHRALAETPPSSEPNDNSEYVDTFAPPADIKKSAMPSTLNVQNQVKQACRKLAIFTCEMQRLFAANKMFDLQMDAECEFYLNTLRQYLNQLEMYKSIEMEHKRGQFTKEKVKAHAERLSLLLEHINRQVREVHIRLVAFDWYIGVKYRGDVTATATAMHHINDNYKENSKIGVINEILQMCNTPPPTAATNSSVTTSSPNTQTATKPEITTIIKSPENKMIDIINKEEVVVNVNPLQNTNTNNNNNNNIFNIYKPDQIRKVANTTNTTTSTFNHNRHPVFYIG